MNSDSSEVEFRLLLEGIYLRYGYDFRDYAASSLRRRISTILTRLRLEEPLALLQMLLKDEKVFREILPHFTVGTSEMFRDPLFFKALRTQVIPVLRTYSSLNLWIAGSSTGEEVFSLAILLKEEGLYERSVIFATDLNPMALKAAQEGIYPAEVMRLNTKNYTEAGGTESLSSYYTSGYGFVKMNSTLTTNVVFS
jgi:chemotaxis protein methyltransferase CheR